ncbi:bifunctional diaminohydroxyphosphoribosylaminopyrimidine deaminase/5-amino-6-(5-phosphoribosylamino)uracil reductase RibD [Flavobacterium sp. ASW18X]|uniref:bifunctional diaminohydroxyphosphoribosylaminopyrimidine deaminase/5-amino-6-(5-phosphoribosylamino)uracil reductase RibD n=1 Tax=Flavobacterium sp. ASW18X TaxID=2572595 RepID=UPI0010AE80F5|nr:bifunctional diaminohydroxyphosphoribosylaminopyrimidine deaminase/5-amino-6-(5-phosphoribosylamino)uracil reductase RibD [Flavobacterium sp. ASW18X]TKD65832.1 bifunctional diaminohydroxyphosphoribosylaminopyrimidine deaminase/5-amino-6-(5-phosphoribosylamino)uracil reductase RibD [Flavobacterium sp. ASW18X]
MNIDEKYLFRCIELGKNALGSAAPNPMVGCVIVYNDKIIGEGFTSPFGGPHAEVNAIHSVKDQSLLQKATLYVTLEPCSHYGKTPPCADLIIEKGIPNIVIGLKDPHEKVAGQGIQKLKDAGKNVVYGILEEECREHHKRFLTFIEKKRPYIILKWAETYDGFLAPDPQMRSKNPEPYWITGIPARQLVHKWRAEEQAILVGTKTVLMDNPSLTVRDWKGKNPMRVVIDKDLKLSATAAVFNDDAKVLVLTNKKTTATKANLTYLTLDFSTPLVPQILKALHLQNITSLIVEGGAKTLEQFITDDLWDEARIFTGNTVFKSGIAAPKITGKLMFAQNLETDSLTILYND